jgi:hypothetical protein
MFVGMSKMDDRDIEVLAFFIWEKQGFPHGRALEHWLEAEYLIRTRSFVQEEDDRAIAALPSPSMAV